MADNKTRKNAGKARKSRANLNRTMYRTELRKKLKHVYRSSGKDAGDAYFDRLCSTDAFCPSETMEQKTRRYAQTDVYKKIRAKEHARIESRKK